MRYIHVVACFALMPGPMWAQSSDQAELLKRVQVLEQRVDRLERASKPGVKPVAGSGISREISTWRAIAMGMSMDEVRGLMGEPHRVSTNTSFTMWYWNYPSGGSVQFSRGGVVEAIQEPSR